MAEINLNVSPYFDDYDPEKDYLRVLFRPGFPVQARELTTLQSFLQTQINRFGEHVFKEGSKVTGGSTTINNEIYRLFLTGSGNTSFPLSGARTASILSTIGNLENLIITNADGSVRAKVIKQPTGTTGTNNVGNLYFYYLTQKKFAATGDYIYATLADNSNLITTELVQTFNAVNPVTIAEVEEGVYFVNGIFSRVDKQTVIIDNNSHTPSAKIGLKAEQSIATQNTDATLFDNARGSSNEGAPGAHRLTQSLTFVVVAKGATTPENFYFLTEVEDGNEVENKTTNPQYADLGKTLARRTYDESGNYFLKPFSLSLEDGDSDTFVAKLGPSKAYVYGYEVDKTGTTKLTVTKDGDTKRTKNFQVPFNNISSYEVSGTPTGTLPGQTGSDPFTYANRLLLKDSDAETIGVARGYSYTNGRLFIYDVKMFQVITTATSLSWSDGNDAFTNRNTGYVYNADGQAGITGNAITLINWSGKFRINQTIKSTVQSTSSTISTAQVFSVNDVSTITGAGGFSATVDPDSFTNPNPELINTLSRHIKTFRGTATVFDNDFTILDDTGISSGDANGYYNESRVDDQEEIEKRLKFKYIKVKNTGSSARTGVNFGWSAQDKLISLAYPDVHEVYGINLSSDSTFANGQFARIEINTTGLVPQGAIVRGLSSGTEAIVTLQNSTTTGAGDIASTSGYHSFLTGTGSTTTLEVIYRKNTSFTTGETLSVISPAGVAAYNSPITHVSNTAAKGKDYIANYVFDNGQRSEFYDIGRLTLKNENKPAPSGDLVIFYSYFEASPVNNFYYSADSYSKLPFYDEDVRYYSEPKEIIPKVDDSGRDLRNSIDFRFRVEDIVTDITKSPFIFSERNYYKQPKIKPNTYFTADLEEYLQYVMCISISKDGGFVIKKGQAVVDNPQKPTTATNAMPLYYLTIPPAVRYPEKEIDIETVDNKRYTMRDIGEIESRINRLEESVALSLLESQALHDDLGSRSKSGFVTDDFALAENNPNSSADSLHEEYNASIDVIENHLIPGQTDGEQIEMAVDSTDSLDPYYLAKNIVIKKYNEETMVEQLNATGSHKINPFATWIFVGSLTLTPSENHWRDRVNNYFTNFNGRIRPFSGDSDQFSQFLKVTTASPGGSSTSRLQWFGSQRTSRRGRTITTSQARRRVTTTTFGKPRAIAGTKPSETLRGTQIIQNIKDHWMRNPAGGIKFEAEGLRPNTSHKIDIGGVPIKTGLVSNSDGKISGTFNIPYQTFKAGKETVQIKDEPVDGRDSNAAATFNSIGHRDFFDVTTSVDNKRVDTQNLGVQVRGRRTLPPPPPIEDDNDDNGDPIAQAFKLPVVGKVTAEQILAGEEFPTQPEAIITSCDLWLSFVDDRPVMDNIIVEIRKMINGYPGGPKQRIGTTGRVKVDKSMQVTTPSSTNYTRFRFKRPVEIREPNEEYCIVLKSPSDATEVFVADLGKQKLDGTGTHDAQPNVGGYFGSFFVSQNQSTWSPEQNTDMMFRLNQANFDINNDQRPPTSSITLKNTISNLKNFNADIGAFTRGLAIETYEYSNYVKVTHPNHGMHFNNAQVTLKGFDKFGTPNNFNGIPDSELNGTHDVLFATLDSYFIKTTTKATSSGKPPVPVFDTFATQPIVYDSLITNILMSKAEGDAASITFTGTETNSLNLEIDSNKIKNGAAANVSTNDPVEIDMNEYIELENPYIIRNQLNATTADLTMKIELESGSKYSSPVFNVDDNLYPVVFRNITGTLLNDSEISTGLTTTSISSGDADATLQEYASYIAAQQSETEFSAYVTKQIDLEIPADGFNIIFDADMEPDSKLEFAYKARQRGDTTPFDQIDWTDFRATQFITEGSHGPFSSDTDYKQFKAEQEVPFEFTSFKIRIRMICKNEAQIPRIKDLRIIADI